MRGHIRALAVLNIVSAALGFVCVVLALACLPLVDMLPPQQTGLLEAYLPPGADARALLVRCIWCLLVFFVVTGIPQLIAGIALLRPRPLARTLGLVAGVVNLVNIPLGTALGVYTLWVLLNRRAAAAFAAADGGRPAER